MKNWLVSILILAPGATLCKAQDSTPAARVEAALARIQLHLSPAGNAERDEDSLDAVLGVLYQHPVVAARLLVEHLTPTTRGKHLDHPLIVWYVRALRSLTGLDFRASTRTQLTDDEKWYLGAKWYPSDSDSGAVRLFGWHMGWDETWVAPNDAQLAIIEKWRRWFAKEGATFKYVNDRDHEHWYF